MSFKDFIGTLAKELGAEIKIENDLCAISLGAAEGDRIVYRNGYREKHGGIDETTGEVNVSFIPKSAIVGWVEIDDAAVFGDIKDNGKRLEHVQTHGRFVFNPEYKAVE